MNCPEEQSDVTSYLESFDNPIDAVRAAILMVLVTENSPFRRQILKESLRYLSSVRPKICNDVNCKYVWASVVSDDDETKDEDPEVTAA